MPWPVDYALARPTRSQDSRRLTWLQLHLWSPAAMYRGSDPTRVRCVRVATGKLQALHAPEWTRTTTDQAVHKALNFASPAWMLSEASKPSSLRAFLDALQASEAMDVAKLLPRIGSRRRVRAGSWVIVVEGSRCSRRHMRTSNEFGSVAMDTPSATPLMVAEIWPETEIIGYTASCDVHDYCPSQASRASADDGACSSGR